MNVVIILLRLPVLLLSCVSIVTKTSYPLNFNSNPSGAKITIVNKKGKEIFSGATPATVTVKASSSYMSGEDLTITLSKQGYEDTKINISAKIDGWYRGNILFGGLIGLLIVDPLSGLMYKYKTVIILILMWLKKKTLNP